MSEFLEKLRKDVESGVTDGHRYGVTERLEVEISVGVSKYITITYNDFEDRGIDNIYDAKIFENGDFVTLEDEDIQLLLDANII